jgi:hypothetical protein
VTICPGFILGPAFCGKGFESGNTILNIMEDKMPYIPPMQSVDVRDVSKAHLNAIKLPAVGNQRFILVQKLMMHRDIAKPLRDEF